RKRLQNKSRLNRRRLQNKSRLNRRRSNPPQHATYLRRTPTTSAGIVRVVYDQLKTQIPEAIRACKLAVQLLPADLTLQYQLARAMELADPARGQAMQDRLVKLNYPAAFDNAGSLLLNDPKCRQHCIREAVKLFKKGADLGDPDSMMSLADQINNGQA